ncbi:phenylacetate--CoA ligase family protein [Vibrio sp. THAF190c]|uniref:phenylacetate--CoA ligase family protein n=1 Tax=Vibrio sp. THAF190c TaxID=2587865 RepID=UPI0012692193|nr:phenylacetate--CoA ligase family protein [Vibrio sp. THAF190c]QFT08592.1 Phenylacetate-coenzyme A ligase [Vibrio sp. THAF190c]
MLERIYRKLPYILKFLIVNFVAVKNNKDKWNSRVKKLLIEYQSLDKKSNCELPELWGNVDMSVAKYTVNKLHLNQNFEDVINKKEVYKTFYTSGTTGQSLKYHISRNFMDHLWAVYWKFRACHGVQHSDWFAYFIGKEILPISKSNPPYWIKSFASKQLLLSQSHLSKETVLDYLQAIKRSNIRCMHGYPSTIAFFSSLIKEGGLIDEARALNIKFISVSSETLFTYQKMLIQEVFGVKVVQIYGMTEGVVNIFECEQGSLHVDEFFSKVEFKPVGDNKYKVIGSSYHNKALPLTKYDTNDLVEMKGDEVCKCGRNGRVVSRILGREEDYVSFPDGRKVGRLDHVFKKVSGIYEAQIYQKEDYSIECRIVVEQSFDKYNEKLLESELNAKLGSLCYEILIVQSISRTKSGKLKFVVSDIKGS